MKKLLVIKFLICALSLGSVLYAYVKQQNDVVRLRIELPRLAQDVRLIEEENSHLRMEIDKFENPKHLMELAKRPEFSHLKYPTLSHIIVVDYQEGSIMSKDPSSQNTFDHGPVIFFGAR